MNTPIIIAAIAAVTGLMQVEEPRDIQPERPTVIALSEELNRKTHEKKATHKQRDNKPTLQKGTTTKKNSCHQPHKSNH